jgi:hypothetical protein
MDCTKALIRSAFPDELLDPAALRNLGILTQKQCDSLTSEEWEEDEAGDIEGPFSMWLGSERIPASELRERPPDSFFAEVEEEEDEDVEMEDADLEPPVVQDDVKKENRLHGEWVCIYPRKPCPHPIPRPWRITC